MIPSFLAERAGRPASNLYDSLKTVHSQAQTAAKTGWPAGARVPFSGRSGRPEPRGTSRFASLTG